MPSFEISLDTANKIYLWGWRASILGAVITFVGVVLLMYGTRVRDRDTESQLAASAERTANAELKTEQLRKELGPRQLQRTIFLQQIAESPKAQVEIMYLRDDPECFDVAQQIWRVLQDAAWDVRPAVPIPLGAPGAAADNPTAMAVDGQPSGVTVVAHGITQAEAAASDNEMRGQPWVRTPWTVLMHALGDSLGRIAGSGGGANAPPAGTLRVVVAPR